MTNDFETKLADLVWSLIEPKIEQKLAQFRDDLGTFDGDLDEKIAEWMRYNFDLSDYHFDITDWSHEIDGLIDQQVQYLAEEGDMKEWLGNRDDDNDEIFRQRVYSVINSEYDIRLVRK